MIFFIDLFCGAGGVSTGVEQAKYRGKKAARVIACVNHDPLAIQSHKANHRNVWHFVEDIKTLDVSVLASLAAQYRKKYPGCIIILWASLECTNHSIAKGGLSRDGDSRTLCDHMDRYVKAINPDYLQIENVREFRNHGPIRIKCSGSHNDRSDLAVDKKNEFIFVPYKERAKEYFNAWRDRICALGYKYEDRDINSADQGEFTSRIRYYAQFAKPHLPIAWPEQTHTKSPLKGSRLKKWKPVKEVLNFSVKGKSIFNRKKALSTKTMARIYSGLIKYVAGGKAAYDQVKTSGVVSALGNGDGSFLSLYYSGDPDSKNSSVSAPARTITTIDHHSLVQTSAYLPKLHNDRWLDKNYSSELNHQSIDQPAGTITTKDHYSLVKACHFLDRQFSSGSKHQSIDAPAGTLLTVPKMNLVSIEQESPFLMDTNYNNLGSSILAPMPTILACRKHHYLISTAATGNGIVVYDQASGEYLIPIYENDCSYTVLVKEFMALYGLSDIFFRMLEVDELKVIQGFPLNYYLAGTKETQKKFIGNSVTPKVPKAMIEATCQALSASVNTFRIAA
jgi:DNA (cytosine-5)-methyltransferase 1